MTVRCGKSVYRFWTTMKRHKDVYRINLKKNICGHGPYRNEIEEKLQIVTQYAHKEGRCNQIQDKFKAENGTHVLTQKSGDFMFSIDMHHNFLPHRGFLFARRYK